MNDYFYEIMAKPEVITAMVSVIVAFCSLLVSIFRTRTRSIEQKVTKCIHLDSKKIDLHDYFVKIGNKFYCLADLEFVKKGGENHEKEDI